MKCWTDTEYVDAYQRYMSVPGTIVSYEDHKQALAEKDREIVKWRRIRTPTHGTCCTCQGCGLDYDSCRCDLDEVCDELDQLKKAYQQLMEQAVRFVTVLVKDGCSDIDDYYAAKAFLKERE